MNRSSARSSLPALLLALGLLAGCGGDASTGSAAGTDSTASGAGSDARSGLAAYDENGDGIVYQGGMHPDVVQDEPGNCPVCGMKLTPTRVDGSSAGGPDGSVKISPATMQNMGVRTTDVETAALGREIQTTGRFEAPDRGMTTVSPKVGGWVEKLYVNSEGQRVRRGQRLMEIYSPELVSTQEEYLLALRNAERMQGSGSESSAEGARRLVEAARRRLSYWDISSGQIEELKRTGEPTKTLTLYAPASGTVRQKRVTEGQQIRAGETLMHLSDLNPLWLMLDVYEQDLSAVEVGSPVVVELPYADDGRKTRGRVDYIYDEVDADSRTVRARVTVPNPGLEIKPGMYAEATIEGERAEPRPVVPTEAVVSGGGGREVVIEALGEGRFRPAEVRTGVASGERVQILSGLKGGERVVTSAQFLIDSEARLQSALGAMTAGSAGTGSTGGMDHGSMSASPEAAGGAWEKQSAQPETTAGGVQVARVTVGAQGFQPGRVALKAGQPVRLLFTRKTEQTCATEVKIPAVGVAETPLPLDETVAVEFTPQQGGTFTFACGMDMLKGSLVVSRS